MSLPLKRSRLTGIHYELALKAAERVMKANFNFSARDEREFENRLVASLEASRLLKPNLITQVNRDQVETINQTDLFGFKHRPDITIGNDGTAIELKVINKSQSIRDMLGQGICYRFDYRFTILVFVSPSPNADIINLCSNKSSSESKLLQSLATNYNIFSIVGPKSNNHNILFKP